MEQVISQLERGTVVKFFSKKRPKKKTLMVKRETGQIVWSRSPTFRSFDGSVKIREVKEVRIGKHSKDFEKWPKDAKRIENLRCFVVYYGSEFRLETLSISALSEKECELWVTGLCHLVQDIINVPYTLQVERWLRKEFYTMKNSHEMVTFKNVKAFLPRVNCKIPTNRLKELFQEVDMRNRNKLDFNDFVILYHKLMFDQNNYVDWHKLLNYSKTEQIVTLQDFQNFLITEQQDNLGNNECEVSRLIREYLRDLQRDIQEPYFAFSEFIDYLFSKHNDIWNPKFNQVSQDMTRPLAHYWIASSHNTYLLGDQFSSESSCQAYVHVLRAGCKCIELDCWDGPDGMPLIFHGLTFTTKIKFLDVIKTIKDHAFDTSEYPVILSIEDNCTLPQQRKMAMIMQEIFGDMLLVQPVNKNETCLPSPYALRRKILLKHKFIRSDESRQEIDLRNRIKTGILYLEHSIDREWNPYFFVLTQQKLFYTELFYIFSRAQETEQNDDEESSIRRSLDSADSTMLDSLPKGSLDIKGAVVELTVRERPGFEWILRIQNPNMCTVFEIATPSKDTALEWMSSIKITAQNASVKERQRTEMERTITKEMSNLIVYCRSVPFNIERIQTKGFTFNEMSSFTETMAKKLICQQENNFFLKYHQVQFSRVYPKGQRIDSSNYNPVPMWNSGCQMVALNYQTGDKSMQLNQAKFKENGNCGYLLKPEFMFRHDFNPYNKYTLYRVESLKISLKIIGARHLMRSGRDIASPFVEIEIIGAYFDSGTKLTTRTIQNNGFNPVWNETCEFEIFNPYFAFIRFLVRNKDNNFIGQATYPVRCLRMGYRSVPLKDVYSEDLELASLLVHVNITTLSNFPDWNTLLNYSETELTVTLQELHNILITEHNQHNLGNNESELSRLITGYLQDFQKDIREPYFVFSEFIEYLFSKHNDIWNPTFNQVSQDMTRPLAHYWIASSHNTYLTGDQITSESSCQAYVRALKAGCRCIEVDCWDGPDGMPLVYHGNTFTTKIKFLDVIKTIKDHAFDTSEYPVILSMEDNCTLSQQRKMATIMQEIFGDMLLVQPVDRNETCLPSPYALRRKILLKHRKLPDSVDESSFLNRNDENRQEIDLRNRVKAGILYLEDPIDREWNPYFFVLTQEKLFYTDTFSRAQETEQNDDEESSIRRSLDSADSTMLDSLPKGSLDIKGAVVELTVGERSGFEWILRIESPSMCTVFEIATPSKDTALEWMSSIRNTAQNASIRESQLIEMERILRIAKEISNLIVYCRSVPFNIERIRTKGFTFNEMSGFIETKAEKLICQQENNFFIKYHQVQFSRVYPKGQRIDSSNLNPVPMWNSGCQMVALNYQTGDKSMQLNQAKFKENGNCGYLLKPEFMFRHDFNPYNKYTLYRVESLKISLKIIGARHLVRSGKDTANPSVEIEIIGADFDSGTKLTTRTIYDNGFNPMWNETCEFEIFNPYFAFIRFLVQDKDMFDDNIFIGQATYPVRCLRTGYRNVPLKNIYSEDLELASLLVYVNITTLSVITFMQSYLL